MLKKIPSMFIRPTHSFVENQVCPFIGVSFWFLVGWLIWVFWDGLCRSGWQSLVPQLSCLGPAPNAAVWSTRLGWLLSRLCCVHSFVCQPLHQVLQYWLLTTEQSDPFPLYSCFPKWRHPLCSFAFPCGFYNAVGVCEKAFWHFCGDYISLGRTDILLLSLV